MTNAIKEENKERKEININHFFNKYKIVLIEDGFKEWVKAIDLKKDINALPEWEKTTLLEKLLKNLGKNKKIELSELEIILDLLSVEWLKISWLQAFEALIQKKGKKWKPSESEIGNFIQLAQILQEKIRQEEESNKDTSLENSQKSFDELIGEIREFVEKDNSIKEVFNVIGNNFNEWGEINSLSFLAIKEKMIKSLDEFISKLDKDKDKNLIEKLQELQKRFQINDFEKILNKFAIGHTENIEEKYYQDLQEKIWNNDTLGIIEAKKKLEDTLNKAEIEKNIKQELLMALEGICPNNIRYKTLFSILEFIINSKFIEEKIKTKIKNSYKELMKIINSWEKEGISKVFSELTKIIDEAKEILVEKIVEKLQEINLNLNVDEIVIETEEMEESNQLRNLQQQFDSEKALFLNPNLDEETLRKIIKNVGRFKNPVMKAIFENIFLYGENNLEGVIRELNKNSMERVMTNIGEIIFEKLFPNYFWGYKNKF